MAFTFGAAGAANYAAGLGFGAIADGSRLELFAGPVLTEAVAGGENTLLAVVTLDTPGVAEDGGLNQVSAVVTAAGIPTSALWLTSDDECIGMFTLAGLAGLGDLIVDDGTEGNDSRATANLAIGQEFTVYAKVPLVGATVTFGPTIPDVGGVRDVDFVQAALAADIATTDTAEAADLVHVQRPSFTQSCTRVGGDETLQVSDSSPMSPGQAVSGTGIATGTTIESITDGTHVELSVAATASGTSTLTFGRTLPLVSYAGSPDNDTTMADESTTVAPTQHAVIGYIDSLGVLLAADNLSDVASASTARSNLGAAAATGVGLPWEVTIPISPEDVDATTGTAKVSYRFTCAVTLNAGNAGARLQASVASSSGTPTVDVNKTGVGSIFSTVLTLDANEKTSLTAATACVLTTTSFADDDEVTIDIDTAGTGTRGLKVTLRGVRA